MANLTPQQMEAAVIAVGKRVNALYIGLIDDLASGDLSWAELEVGLRYQLGQETVDDFRELVIDSGNEHLIKET